jgi:anti-sigma factor RsiW
MGCDVAYEELSAFAAGDLEAERARPLEAHVAVCTACSARLKAIRSLDARLRALPRVEPPPAAILNARRALSAELRGARAPEIMTLEEVAEYLRVSPGDLADVASDLPAFELAGQIRVRRSRLVEWIERREQAYTRTRIESEAAHMVAGLL